MTPDERATRAVAIRTLLEDPLVIEAFKDIEADLTKEWRGCADPEQRENIWRALHVMDRMKAWMASGASWDMTALKRTGVKNTY